MDPPNSRRGSKGKQYAVSSLNVLPRGGYRMQLVEAYFDESGSHSDSSVLCVAGYIIEKNAATLMDTEWLDALNAFHLPYFRMSDCAHGTGPFSALTKDQRTDVEKAMIRIIKSRTSQGMAVTVSSKEFNLIMPDLPEIGTPYAFCTHACLAGVKWWANQTNYSGDIAYFFESGHRSQSEANAIMNTLFNIPQQRIDHRYVSHTFVDKKKVRPVQAADLLAWQWHTDRKRTSAGKGRRLDCAALVGEGKPPHRVLHYDTNLLYAMRDRALSRRFPLTYPLPDPFK